MPDRELTALEMRAGEHPWEVILEALDASVDGPVPEDLSDAAALAGDLVAAGVLVRAGCAIDDVVRQFEEREHVVRFKYDGEEIALEIDWEDGGESPAPVLSVVDP